MYLNYILCVSLLFFKKYFYALLYITWLFIVGKIFYIFYILYFVFKFVLYLTQVLNKHQLLGFTCDQTHLYCLSNAWRISNDYEMKKNFHQI
ncbi:hypothetical protein KUTeg_004518 [Tegillarca granosa]|uniref:Uncharacterized protein n=1 Tax=Tegillarca granosa TaxID=220873 RepID=A0ABQ9FRX1_TEGGR|nr:hypothetical protein KUTeg_004518 [Tegillarca granosa]